MIAHLDMTAEAKRQAAQAAIDAAKSAAERNRLGQFATPNALAIDIARFVKTLIGKRDGIRFADPSVGSGSFFSAALTVFGADRIEAATGIEVDPVFVGAARDLWGAAGLQVIHADFTHVVAGTSPPCAPNLILANPPYVRHHHLTRSDKERLQRLAFQMTGVEVNGLAGLYVYFLLLATAWMEENGYAAWLIPSEFMDVNYGKSLKRFLTEQVTLIRAHRFDPGDVQFGDAFVSSAVLVFKKTPPPNGHAIEFTYGGTLTKPQAQDQVGLERLRASRKWSAFPRHAQNDRRMLGNGQGPTLADFFRIRRGIATGDNNFFILDRNDARRLGLPPVYLRPILPSPRHLKTTVIDAADDGYPLLDRQLCVIDCDLPEHLVQKHHPALWGYLQSGEKRGVRDGYLAGKRSLWYRQEQRQACLFLCTYMGRGTNDKQPFRFILNRSQAIATNLYLMLYPRGALDSMLRKHPHRADAIHELLSQITGYELRGEGRVYGGGLNKIEPSELGRISAAAITKRWPELSQCLQRIEPLSLFQE